MVHTLTIGLSPYRTQITWHCTGCYSAWQFWAHAISCPSCKLFAGYIFWNRQFLATLLLLPNREKLKSRSKNLENQSQAIHQANRGKSVRKGKKIQNQRRSKIIVHLNTNDVEMTFFCGLKSLELLYYHGLNLFCNTQFCLLIVTVPNL